MDNSKVFWLTGRLEFPSFKVKTIVGDSFNREFISNCRIKDAVKYIKLEFRKEISVEDVN